MSSKCTAGVIGAPPFRPPHGNGEGRLRGAQRTKSPQRARSPPSGSRAVRTGPGDHPRRRRGQARRSKRPHDRRREGAQGLAHASPPKAEPRREPAARSRSHAGSEAIRRRPPSLRSRPTRRRRTPGTSRPPGSPGATAADHRSRREASESAAERLQTERGARQGASR